MVLVETDLTVPSQNASATNNQIISWAYHNLFSGFSYPPLGRTEIPRPRTDAGISILDSVLNFAGRKSLTDQCVNCHFYITPFHHLIENTLGICCPGRELVAPFSILSIPPSL